MDRSRLTTTTLLVACLMTGSAGAQTRSDDADYDRAGDLRREQHLPEALALYEEIHARTNQPRARAQMGVTEAQMGRWVIAEQHLTEALASGDRWVRHHRDDLQRALVQVREHLDDLTVTANVAGAELRVDDTSMGRLPRGAVRVATGPVVIDVVADGYEPHRQTVQAIGAATQVTVTLVPRVAPAVVSAPTAAPVASAPTVAPVPAPMPSARLDVVVRTEHPDEAAAPLRVDVPLSRPAESGGLSRSLAWASAGIGLGFAGAGIAALVVGSGAASTWNSDACFSTTATRAETCADQASTAESMRTLTIVGFVGAGVLAGASVALFVASTRSGARAATRAGLTCGPGVGTVGLACGGRF